MRVIRRIPATHPDASGERRGALVAWLREYGDRRVNSRLIDERRTIPPYVVLDFGNQGLLGLNVDEKYDGLALRFADIGRVLEQASAIDLSLGTFLLTSLFPGVQPISAFGSAALKDELLPGLARGRMLAGYAQTEPGAGTHFPAMQARAVRTGPDRWRLCGEKVWIGNASWAGVLTVMAHDVEEDGKRHGLTAFAVRTDRPGVELGAELLSLGMRGMVQNEVRFRDVEVELADVVGAPENGLEVGVDSMSFSRFAIAATCIGAMKRCSQLMLRFGSRRQIATGRLLDHPDARIALGEAVARIAACEALLYRTMHALDEGAAVSAELLAACKVVASEFGFATADRTVQLLGSRGYDEESGAPQILRDVRVTRIFEGATEPLLAFVGAQALNPRSDLYRTLHDDLGAGALAEQLASAVGRMRQRESAWEGGALPRPRQLALAGRASVWCLVAAHLGAEPERLPASLRDRARAWAEAQLGRALDWAAAGDGGEALMAPACELADAVAAFEGSVGDGEQSLPGERRGLDPFLRREAPHGA